MCLADFHPEEPTIKLVDETPGWNVIMVTAEPALLVLGKVLFKTAASDRQEVFSCFGVTVNAAAHVEGHKKL